MYRGLLCKNLPQQVILLFQKGNFLLPVTVKLLKKKKTGKYFSNMHTKAGRTNNDHCFWTPLHFRRPSRQRFALLWHASWMLLDIIRPPSPPLFRQRFHLLSPAVHLQIRILQPLRLPQTVGHRLLFRRSAFPQFARLYCALLATKTGCWKQRNGFLIWNHKFQRQTRESRSRKKNHCLTHDLCPESLCNFGCTSATWQRTVFWALERLLYHVFSSKDLGHESDTEWRSCQKRSEVD